MKLLFDQNLSPRLVTKLEEIYPDSIHVQDIALDYALDTDVWEYAKAQGFIIVSKDADFSEFSLLKGAPPKVIWIRIGNCTTNQIALLLKENYEAIVQLVESDDIKVLSLL